MPNIMSVSSPSYTCLPQKLHQWRTSKRVKAEGIGKKKIIPFAIDRETRKGNIYLHIYIFKWCYICTYLYVFVYGSSLSVGELTIFHCVLLSLGVFLTETVKGRSFNFLWGVRGSFRFFLICFLLVIFLLFFPPSQYWACTRQKGSFPALTLQRALLITKRHKWTHSRTREHLCLLGPSGQCWDHLNTHPQNEHRSGSRELLLIPCPLFLK